LAKARLFPVLLLGALLVLTSIAYAQEAAAGTSVGDGLKGVGAGLAIGLSGVGAGVAVGRIGAVSVSVIAEKPEMFGRSLIYVALGEGIAIYGLLIAILLLPG
jgi:V/A-type H+-transporting ATPase subunit K